MPSLHPTQSLDLIALFVGGPHRAAAVYEARAQVPHVKPRKSSCEERFQYADGVSCTLATQTPKRQSRTLGGTHRPKETGANVCVRQDRRQRLLSTCVSNQEKECAYHERSSAVSKQQQSSQRAINTPIYCGQGSRGSKITSACITLWKSTQGRAHRRAKRSMFSRFIHPPGEGVCCLLEPRVEPIQGFPMACLPIHQRKEQLA